MPELSKTARASMGKEVKKEKAEETVEEAIRQLRLNLQAKLYITPERIQKLLEAYDSLITTFRGTTILLATQTDRVRALEQTVLLQNQELEKYLELGRQVQTEPSVAVGVDLGFAPPAVVVMKDPAFDHPHEDEHHLVDFGHNTTHSKPEGA